MVRIAHARPERPARWPVILVILALAGCTGSPGVTPTTVPTTAPTTAPTAVPTPTTATDPYLGHDVVAFVDELEVRSLPGVGAGSIAYTPSLPIGTGFRVVRGPVVAPDGGWYLVELAGLTLLDETAPEENRVSSGWVRATTADGRPTFGNALAAVPGTALLGTVQRSTVDPSLATTAATVIDTLAVTLYRQLLADGTIPADSGGVISPTSIALAFAMVRAGADGATAAEIDRLLGITGWAELGPSMNALERALAAEATTGTGWDGDYSLQLRLANQVFGQTEWPIVPAFLDDLSVTFGAGIRQLDFATDPEAARQTINAWVKAQTSGRIPELLREREVSDRTRIALVNALYLRANWVVIKGAELFSEKLTADRPFTRPDGTAVEVPTMEANGSQSIPVVRGKGWTAVEIPYRAAAREGPLSMLMILPDDLAAYERALTASGLEAVATKLTAEARHLTEDVTDDGYCGSFPYEAHLFVPRFTTSTHADLVEPFRALGLSSLFDADRADLTGIHVPADANDRLFIAHVVHMATVAVDESGTEAAAATAMMGETGGCTGPEPAKEITVRFDHPFLFAIRDRESGAILFIGRVTDPSAK